MRALVLLKEQHKLNQREKHNANVETSPESWVRKEELDWTQQAHWKTERKWKEKKKKKGEGTCANPEMLEMRKGKVWELPSPTIPPHLHLNQKIQHFRRDFSAKTIDISFAFSTRYGETSLETTGQFIDELGWVKQNCTENTPAYSEVMGWALFSIFTVLNIAGSQVLWSVTT